MNLELILRAIPMVGAALPAFKELFDAAVATLGEDDQETAKARYREAMAASDKVHADLQRALKE